MYAGEALAAAAEMLESYATTLRNGYHCSYAGRWGHDDCAQEARALHDDLQAMASRLVQLGELAELLDDPAVLLRIPKHQRLRISELLHCDAKVTANEPADVI